MAIANSVQPIFRQPRQAIGSNGTSSGGVQPAASTVPGTTTPAPTSVAGSTNPNAGNFAANLATQITADLTANAAAASGANTTTSTTGTSATTTDNPFMDWLGLSNTPDTPLIAGVPNWILLAGGIGLLAYLASSKKEG